MSTVSYTNLYGKGNPIKKGLPFSDIKDVILGSEYSLSLVIADQETMRTLNRERRDKDYATDILSFSLDETSGEIFIYPDTAASKAVEFGREFENYILFLFIHGCFHLKGFDHGSTMESNEARIRAQFGV